jgi:hypothetical protein
MSPPQPYTIGWLRKGQDICVSHQCHLHYDMKTFKYEVLCDVTPLEVCNFLLGQPYVWKPHVVYESRPCSVIINLEGRLYRVPKVVQTNTTYLIFVNQCIKVISHTKKFVLFMVWSEGEWNIIAISKTRSLYIAKVGGKDSRIKQRHLCLTYWGDFALSGKSLNLFDTWCSFAQWPYI